MRARVDAVPSLRVRSLRRSASLRRLGLTTALALGACTSHKGPSIPLEYAGSPPAGSGKGCADAVPERLTAMEVNKVRVTLRSRDTNGKTLDFCDRIINFPSTPPYLRLAENGAAKSIDIYVEAFLDNRADAGAGAGVTRVATGSLVGVAPDDNKLGALRLFKTEQFGCAPLPSNSVFGQPRAFHTATLLPDGRVLFYGGLVANATDPSQRAIASNRGVTTTDIAEIYDPRDQTRTPVGNGDAAAGTDMGVTPDMASAGTDGGTSTNQCSVIRPGRAFHSAALLSSPGPCKSSELALLVVGGVQPGQACEPILTLEQGSTTVASRFQSSGSGVGAPFDVHAAPNEIFCLDPAANTGRHVPLPGAAGAFRASAIAPAGFVVAGGVAFDSTMLNELTAPSGPDLDVFSLSTASDTTGSTTNLREGATLTILPNGQGLLWGGNLYTDPVAELLGELKDAPYSVAASVSGATPTAFHTATLLPQADTTMPASVLVTGGFAITSDNTNRDPPLASNAVALLSVQGGAITTSAVPFGTNPTTYPTVQQPLSYPSAAPCTDPARYRPAGFESAVSLDRGRVLITGGTPATDQSGSHCADCPTNVTASPLCAVGQASLYENSTLVPTMPMMVPRFGHTSTVLKDGSVMIFGGIGQLPNAMGTTDNVFINDVELYNPRSPTPPYDAQKMLDSDDPIADLLASEGLVRGPAEQAHSTSKPGAPAKSCGTL